MGNCLKGRTPDIGRGFILTRTYPRENELINLLIMSERRVGALEPTLEKYRGEMSKYRMPYFFPAMSLLLVI